jgi:hypothetical protein
VIPEAEDLMKTTPTATIKQEQDWILIQSPYSASFVEQLKETVPWQARAWERPIWKVKPTYLDPIRSLLSTVAQKEGWEVLDYTAQPKEAIEEQKQTIAQNDLDRHVEAVIAVLPKLPSKALRLVDWQQEHLTFELRQFLGDDLFKELTRASLDAYRPTILFGGTHKREFSHTFIVAADDRILHELCHYAGIRPLNDERGYGSNVEYFVVRDVALTTTFENGVAHFRGEDDSFWIGIPYQRVGIDLFWSRESWQVTSVGDVLYLLFERETTVCKLIDVRESQYVNPGFGNVAVASSHPSQVASFVLFTHSEAWFKEWGNALVQSDKLTPAVTAKPRWYDFDWRHPADALLSHISFTRKGGPEMCALLGWDKNTVDAHRSRILQLKKQAAQRVIDDMKARSSELALPLLRNLTIQGLLEIGARHNVELKKSWGKERIAQALGTYPEVCESIIGLTKRLEGK